MCLRNLKIISALLFLFLMMPHLSGYGELNKKTLFAEGEEGFPCFRIPALIVTPGGRLLAFCEGRKHATSDTGDIALFMKTSEDNGQNWSPLRIIWEDPGTTCGNPCPVVDAHTRKIWLLMTWNLGEDREEQIIRQESRDTRRIFLSSSSDDGESWSTPDEITGSVKKKEWTWYATGPGNGIQIEKGPFSGRLIIPCDHIEAETKSYYSHIIYSDDHGVSWHLGGRSPQDQVNECCVVEVGEGHLLLHMRNYDQNCQARQIAFRSDGGMHWENQRFDRALIEPICQASLIRYQGKESAEKRLLFFSNPAHEKRRIAMTIRRSSDEGQSWDHALLLHPGPSAYSSLAQLPQGWLGCLFEGGEKSPNDSIIIVRIPLDEFVI